MTPGADPQPYVAFEDFLEAEVATEGKREWLDGVVYAMGGGSLEHGRLAVNMTAALKSSLAGKCTVYSADAMVYVRETQLATYPDGSVVRGPVDSQKVERSGRVIGEAMTNPTLIVEVLSPSTETYDRTEKFAHYMRLRSLQEYVLVSSEERRIEVHRRPGGRGHWTCDVGRAGDTLTMCGQPFRVDDIYAA